jgi:hypothetical protein
LITYKRAGDEELVYNENEAKIRPKENVIRTIKTEKIKTCQIIDTLWIKSKSQIKIKNTPKIILKGRKHSI